MLGLSILPPTCLRLAAHLLSGSRLRIRPALAAWLIPSAGGKPIPFFGPHLLPLIGLHAAEVYRHYRGRDNTLALIPALGKGGQPPAKS